MSHRKFARFYRVFIVMAVLGALFLIKPKPAHAQDQCSLGDLICELRQAGQSLIDQYLTPVEDWAIRNLTIQIYTAIYNVLHWIATSLWGLQKGFITVGVGVGVVIQWISQNFLQPMISVTTKEFSPIASGFFVIAIGILGSTYLLAAFVRLDIVSPRSAITWYIVGLLYFSLGPQLYLSMDGLRASISSFFYGAATTAMQSQSPFGTLAQGDSSISSNIYGMSVPCNNFPAFINGDTQSHLNGLDIALAYLKADGYDIVSGGSACLSGGQTTDLPRTWYDEYGYFDKLAAPPTWADPGLSLTGLQEQAQATIQWAGGGIARLVNSTPLILFGISEQLVSLCLAIAEGLTFISFSCAILFAFFRRTEPIALTIVDLWIALIIQTVVIAMIQAMVVALYISAAQTGSPLITLAVAVVGMVLMAVLLLSGIKAIWRSFNHLFDAFSMATGGTIVSTRQASQAAAGAALGAASLAVTGGAAMLGGSAALMNGGTWAQATGVAFGGSRALDGAAFSLARLPGLRDTALGEAANQYVEGAATRRAGNALLGPAGALAGATVLTDRNPNHEEAVVGENGQVYWRQPMLSGWVDKGMDRFVGGPTWNDGERTSIGRGGRVMRGEGGEPLRREDFRDEMQPLLNGSRRTATFVPTSAGTIGVNNDGNLDETIDDDVKRDLRSDRESRAVQGSRPTSDGSTSQPIDTARLEAAAQAMNRPASSAGMQSQAALIEGRLSLSGTAHLAGVMSSAINQMQQQNLSGADNRTVANAMAQAVGVTPVERDGRAVMPIERNLPRFQMFADQALQMGLSGGAVHSLIREVKASPDGQLSADSRDRLISQQHDKGQSWQDSIGQVQRLEHTVRMLPGDMTAYGMKSIPGSAAPTQPVIFTPPAETGATPIIFTPAARRYTDLKPAVLAGRQSEEKADNDQ